MKETPKIKLLSLEMCPKCEALKNALYHEQIPYDLINMSSAEGLTELRVNNYFGSIAPVLIINNGSKINVLGPDSSFKSDDTVNIDLIRSIMRKTE